MGLFDSVKCEYPLPNPEVQDDDFQTKSFYRHLEKYILTTEGHLIHNSSYWGEVQVPFDGSFRFHTARGNYQDNTFEWFEFEADFAKGQLQNIKRIKRE